MKILLGALLLAATCSLQAIAATPNDKPCDSSRWAKDMAKFEAADKAGPAAAGGVVFVGSSSIRLWDLEKYFPELGALNRGFGGSELCDSVHYFDTLVAKHKPRVVVLYAGDNDIANRRSPERVRNDFREFVAKMKKALPETRLLYIAIKPSVLRWQFAPQIAEANKLIAADCEEDEQTVFLDVWAPMLGDDGRPRKELLAKDGLHMSGAGYEIWTKMVREQLEAATVEH